eukprot:758247-Hanusia_phi.AAC.3
MSDNLPPGSWSLKIRVEKVRNFPKILVDNLDKHPSRSLNLFCEVRACGQVYRTRCLHNEQLVDEIVDGTRNINVAKFDEEFEVVLGRDWGGQDLEVIVFHWHPSSLFISQPHMYSSFDCWGVPTHNSIGKALDAEVRAALQQEMSSSNTSPLLLGGVRQGLEWLREKNKFGWYNAFKDGRHVMFKDQNASILLRFQPSLRRPSSHALVRPQPVSLPLVRPSDGVPVASEFSMRRGSTDALLASGGEVRADAGQAPQDLKEQEIQFDIGESEKADRGSSEDALPPGLLHYLATAGGRDSHSNLARSKFLQLHTSSKWVRGSPDQVLEPGGSFNYSGNERNGWLCLELPRGLRFFPSGYALRHGLTGPGKSLLHWSLLASVDGHEWLLLKSHQDDRSLQRLPQPSRPGAGVPRASFVTASFKLKAEKLKPLDGLVTAEELKRMQAIQAANEELDSLIAASGGFKFFKIRLDGPDSSGTWSLSCSGLELFGKLVVQWNVVDAAIRHATEHNVRLGDDAVEAGAGGGAGEGLRETDGGGGSSLRLQQCLELVRIMGSQSPAAVKQAVELYASCVDSAAEVVKTLAIVGEEPQLEYSKDRVVGSQGAPLPPLSPRVMSGTKPLTFHVSPSLPAGVKLDQETGMISGVPLEASQLEVCVKLSSPAGSSSFCLRFVILPLLLHSKTSFPFVSQEQEAAGLMQYLATGGAEHEWKNPSASGKVTLRTSGWLTEEDNILASSAVLSSSYDAPLSWFSVELPAGVWLRPTHYLLRHGYNTSSNAMSHWVLEGSVDGETWETLRRHEEDKSLHERFAVKVWAVGKLERAAGVGRAEEKIFRWFRVMMTGRNNSGSLQLRCSGFELFGEVFVALSLPALRSTSWFVRWWQVEGLKGLMEAMGRRLEGGDAPSPSLVASPAELGLHTSVLVDELVAVVAGEERRRLRVSALSLVGFLQPRREEVAMSISSLLEDEDEDVRALTFLLLKDVSRRHRQLVLHLLRRLLVRPLESASCRPPRPLLEMDRSSWKQHVEVPPALFLGPPEKVEEQVSRAVQGREVDELLAGLLADAMEEEEIAELCRIAQEGVELSSRRERIDRLLVMLTSSAWTLRYAACCLLPWVTERGNPKVVVSLIAAMQDEEVAVKVEVRKCWAVAGEGRTLTSAVGRQRVGERTKEGGRGDRRGWGGARRSFEGGGGSSEETLPGDCGLRLEHAQEDQEGAEREGEEATEPVRSGCLNVCESRSREILLHVVGSCCRTRSSGEATDKLLPSRQSPPASAILFLPFLLSSSISYHSPPVLLPAPSISPLIALTCCKTPEATEDARLPTFALAALPDSQEGDKNVGRTEGEERKKLRVGGGKARGDSNYDEET